MKVVDAKVWCKDEERWRLEVLVRLDQTSYKLKQVVDMMTELLPYFAPPRGNVGAGRNH